MKQFVLSIQKLSKIIQDDQSLVEQTYDFVDLLQLSESELEQIRKEVVDIKLIDSNDFWDLTEEVYKSLILKTIQLDLLRYFKKLQENQTFIIRYNLHPWHKFSLTAENIENPEKKHSVVLEMKTSYAEKQLQTLLDHFQIKGGSWKDDLYDFDYHFNFESVVETLFRELVFECWKEVKPNTISFITEINGGSYTYDLSNGENLDKMNLTVQEYIDQASSTKNNS